MRAVPGDVFVASRRVLNSDYYLVATVPTAISEAPLAQIRLATLVTGLVVALLAFFILRVLVRRAVKAIVLVSEQLDEIASGEADLSQELTVHGHNEVGVLAKRFNRFIASLADLIRQVAADTNSLSAEKDEIVANATETASSVNEIASNIGSVSSSVDRLHESIESTAGKVQEITAAIGRMEAEVNAQVSAIEQTSASVEEMNAFVAILDDYGRPMRARVSAL